MPSRVWDVAALGAGLTTPRSTPGCSASSATLLRGHGGKGSGVSSCVRQDCSSFRPEVGRGRFSSR